MLQRAMHEVKRLTAQHADERPTTIPFSERCDALVGGLGWDTDRPTIEARSKLALATAGIPDSDIVSLKDGFNNGSAGEERFTNPEIIDQARAKFKDMKLKLQEPPSDKVVWCDTKQTKDELKPSGMVHRMHAFSEEMESLRVDNLAASLATCLRGKHVVIEGHGMPGFVNESNSTWIWTSKARARCTTEVLEEGMAYANSGCQGFTVLEPILINAGSRARTSVDIDTIVASVELEKPQWSFICILEADSLEKQSDITFPEFIGTKYLCYRNWPGVGSLFQECESNVRVGMRGLPALISGFA
jgi:hypothetical protein